MNIVTIGYMVEGTTDVRFLGSIIRRTFEDVAFECTGEIEVYEPQLIPANGNGFVQDAMKAAVLAERMGLLVLCIHADADAPTDDGVFEHKINPTLANLDIVSQVICRNIVPIVPVQMAEAWMLADSAAFITELGTAKGEKELGLPRHPETRAQPKAVIKEAIRLSNVSLTQRQRRRQPGISELYLPLGQKVDLQKLERLSSYRKFREGVRAAYKKLNYLYD